MNRAASRSCERLNCNNNRCNHDNVYLTTSPTSTTLSDGQESVTDTATSQSEMSSTESAGSLYKRFQLRVRSKSRGKKGDKTGMRSVSPESQTTTNSESENERRGRRGLWELQKEARLRVLGPESRVGRWVGKLRSRSSEARLGTLKSRYSDIRNWEGWKFEAEKMPADGRVNVYDTPTIAVNDKPVLYPEYGKKMIRARSTEAISWGPKKDRSRDDFPRRSPNSARDSPDFARESPIRKSFEKAIDNKRSLSPEAHSVFRPPRLHSGFESEPNLARRHIYDERRFNERRRPINGSESVHHAHVGGSKNYDTQDSEHHRQNRRSCNESRQSCQSSSERPHYNDRSWREADRQHTRCESAHADDRRHIYQKNQRSGHNSNTVPRNLTRKPPNGRQLSSQPQDSHSNIRSRSGSRGGNGSRHEPMSHNVNAEAPRLFQGHNVAIDGRRCPMTKSHSTNNIDRSGSSRNSRRHRTPGNRRHHERTFESQPVVAQYIPPRIPSNGAQVKKCTVGQLKPGLKPTERPPPHNMSTKVSMSCTALNQINSNANIQRCQSEQQLKRSSLASVVSLESMDSGTSCSSRRQSPLLNNNYTQKKTNQDSENQGNISFRSSDSSDSGYRSPVSEALLKKDYGSLESLVLSSCFGEKVKVPKRRRPAINTSDYESESGYDDRGITRAANMTNVSRNASKHRSTERLQRIDDDDDDDKVAKHQKSPHRRSPRKNKHQGESFEFDRNCHTFSLDIIFIPVKILNLGQ